MKKMLVILLCLSLGLFILAGCSNDEPAANDQTQTEVSGDEQNTDNPSAEDEQTSGDEVNADDEQTSDDEASADDEQTSEEEGDK